MSFYTIKSLILILALAIVGQTFGYDGPIVDAHSQIDCETDPDLVITKLKESKVRHTLLVARPCKNALYIGQSHLDSIADREPSLVSKLVSTKLNNKSFDIISWSPNSIGVGEIIFQHHSLEIPGLKFEGYSRPLKNDSLIREVKSKGFPVIIHIELKDFSQQREETLNDLEEELIKDPTYPILLIHMGQFDAELAKKFLSKHKNLYFLMSMTTPTRLDPALTARENGQISQQGWESLFEGNKFKGEWKELIQKYPDNFLLAFENVFKKHWIYYHVKTVNFWRGALDQLDANVATKVACENSVNLWKLSFDCK